MEYEAKQVKAVVSPRPSPLRSANPEQGQDKVLQHATFLKNKKNKAVNEGREVGGELWRRRDF